jgi:cytidine deaminase
MTSPRETLIAAARGCCRQAHAPYSGIRVGAAVRSADGAVYLGTNVENAAYPLGNCAETSAIAAGVQAEGAAFRIAEIAVWATDRDDRTLASSPCGGCRQRIREFAANGAVAIHFSWREGRVETVALDDLLPFAFFLPAGPQGR